MAAICWYASSGRPSAASRVSVGTAALISDRLMEKADVPMKTGRRSISVEVRPADAIASFTTRGRSVAARVGSNGSAMPGIE